MNKILLWIIVLFPAFLIGGFLGDIFTLEVTFVVFYAYLVGFFGGRNSLDSKNLNRKDGQGGKKKK